MTHIKRSPSFLIIPLISLGITWATLTSGRDLESDWFKFEVADGNFDGGLGWVLSVITLMTVGVALSVIYINKMLMVGANSFNQEIFKTKKSFGAITTHQYLAGHTKNAILFFYFTAFFVANNLINSAFGAVPTFNHQFLYSWIVFFAVYVDGNKPADVFIKAAKLGMLGLLSLSLVMLILWPSLAIQNDYAESILGINSRLWGVGSHPNSIGPLALAFLLLEHYLPYRSKLSHGYALAVSAIVFILAQSKTAWSAGLVIFFVITWFNFTKNISVKERLYILILLVFVSGIFAISGCVISELGLIKVGGSINLDEGLSTFSGRDQIWMVAIDVWSKNPIVGYGPTIWGEDFKFAIGMPFAFHAHNQLLQSLSGAGLLGAVTALTYLFALGAFCIRAGTQTKGISVALFTIILFRCVSEIPLSLNVIMNGEFLMHLIAFRLALLGGGERVNRLRLS